MMTIHEAAEYLTVSVEYVSKLLTEGRLQSLSLNDVVTYKRHQDRESTDALDELAKQAQELGLY